MRALRILLSVVFLVAFAVSAMAASVNISGAMSGSYTLNSMSIDSNGNITLNVSGGSQQGAPTLSLNPTSLPAGTQGTAYSQAVTMSASGGTPQYTYNCSGSGVPGLVASPSGQTCSISGTPSASGTYTVTFTARDSAATTASNMIAFSVNTSPTQPGAGVPISEYPFMQAGTIAAGGADIYYFDLPRYVTSLMIGMSSADWSTNQDMIVSNSSQPAGCNVSGILNRPPSASPWYNITTDSNERLSLYNIQAQAGQRFYITICNRSASTGMYSVYWQGY